MDVKYLRGLVGGIPTTIDLTASGTVLQAADFQVVNAGVTASKPAKLDANKKLVSGDINLASEVTGNLPYSNMTIADADLTIAKTSGLQTALDAKLALSGGTMSGPIAMGSQKITALANGTSSNDAVNLGQLQAAEIGADFQPDVLDVQVDDTLDPGATPATGARYIVTDVANLHANFGTIAGVGDDDIVRYDGADFVVVFDASGHSVGGVLTWSIDDATFYNYSGSEWAPHGGLSGVTTGDGLTKSGNTINVGAGTGITVNADDVAIDFGVAGSKAISATDLAAVSNAKGASLIGIEDSGTLTSQTNVEAFLAENRGLIDTNTTHKGSDGSDHSIVSSNAEHVALVTGNPHAVTKAQVSLGNVDNVQQMPLSYLDTDVTLAADSDSKVPSQKAVKAFVESVGQKQVDFPGVAGESLLANKTYVVRKAITGESAGKIYICTSDEENAAGKHLAIGMVQTVGAVSVDDPVTVLKFKAGVALKSADSVIGASTADNGKAVYLNKAGAFSLDPDAGITTGEKYASRIVGIIENYDATVTNQLVTIDVCVAAWFGFDLGA